MTHECSGFDGKERAKAIIWKRMIKAKTRGVNGTDATGRVQGREVVDIAAYGML